MNLFVGLSALLAVIVSQHQIGADYADECVTPTNIVGQCVPIPLCKPIVTTIITYGYNIPDSHRQFIKQSFCGVFGEQNHVCCPTADIKLNTEVVEQLQKLHCGYFDYPRVANGQEAMLFSFPWMALLKYDDETNPFKCAGTLITERYVLTAAHCVEDSRYPVLEVRLGEHNVSSVEDCQLFGKKLVCAPPVQDIGIEEIIIHPSYSRFEFKHDIALIRLNRPVEFQRHIGSICLPITPELMNTTPYSYIVSGWGYTERGRPSDVLLWANLPRKDRNTCNEDFRYVTLTEGQLCVGGNNLQDTCSGDSGGPITQTAPFRNTFKMIQFGIVSFGIKSCGKKSVPAVYTNVPYYMQWITDNIKA